MPIFGGKANRKPEGQHEDNGPGPTASESPPAWQEQSPPVVKEEPMPPKTVETAPRPQPAMERKGVITIISHEITIKGELLGDGDVTLEGRVEGKITLKKNLVVGEKGHVEADVHAATVTISGKVVGNVFAENKVEIVATGFLEGNIHSPKIVIAEGAHFKGSVDMSDSPKMPASSAAPPKKENNAAAAGKSEQGQLKQLGEDKKAD